MPKGRITYRTKLEFDFKRVTYKKWLKRPEGLYVGLASGGCIIGDCFKTPNCVRNANIRNFLPSNNGNTRIKRAIMLDAVAKLETEQRSPAPDESVLNNLVGVIAENRRGMCEECAVPYHGAQSPKQQSARATTDYIRHRMCAQQDGCVNPDCCNRGMASAKLLEFNHFGAKRFNLGNSKSGATSDDVKEEAGFVEHPDGTYECTKGEWICRFCHRFDHRSTGTMRCTREDMVNDGRVDGKVVDQRQLDRHKRSPVVVPKQEYNDALKRAVGKCELCGLAWTLETTTAFEWDHRDELSKMRGPNALLKKNQCGVGGIVNDCASRRAIDEIVTVDGVTRTVREWILFERSKCRLLCTNCHHCHTRKLPFYVRPGVTA